jgi:hypothetical protein
MPFLLCSWRVLQRPAYSYQGAGPGRAGRAWKAGAKLCFACYVATGQQLQRAGGGGNSCQATAEGAWGRHSMRYPYACSCQPAYAMHYLGSVYPACLMAVRQAWTRDTALPKLAGRCLLGCSSLFPGLHM